MVSVVACGRTAEYPGVPRLGAVANDAGQGCLIGDPSGTGVVLSKHRRGASPIPCGCSTVHQGGCNSTVS